MVYLPYYTVPIHEVISNFSILCLYIYYLPLSTYLFI